MSRYMEHMSELYDPQWPGESTLCAAAAFLSNAMIDSCSYDGNNAGAWTILYEARKQVLKQLLAAGAGK